MRTLPLDGALMATETGSHLDPDSSIPCALTIAGSDSGGGAGIQADLLSFAAQGVYGTSALTCVTAQNPHGVTEVLALSAAMVTEQVAQVMEYYPIGAIKTGMLFNEEIVVATANILDDNLEIPAVVDPVMVAASGAPLLQAEAEKRIKSDLLPKATLITPNLDEAAVLLGYRPCDPAEMERAAGELASACETSVLLKGGHLEGDSIVDCLHLANGETHLFSSQRVKHVNTHGSGCTLSSAICAFLARGLDLKESVARAHLYLQRSLSNPLVLPRDSFISHLT